MKDPKQKCAVQHLAKNEEGFVAPLFGMMIVPIVLLIGIAVDNSRALRMQDRMQNTIDNAVTFVMSPNGEAAYTEAKKQEPNLSKADFAKKVFTQQFGTENAESFDGPLTLTFTPDGDSKIVAKAEGRVRSMFGGLASITSINTEGRAVVEAEQGTGQKLEVGMMIDVTGSMGATRGGMTKMAGLKIAAQDLLDKLYPNGDDANVRVAIAPVADYVNAGDYAAEVTGLSDTGSYAKSENLTQTKQGKFSGSYSGFWGTNGANQPAGTQFGAQSASVSGGSTYSNTYCTSGNQWETYGGYIVGVEVDDYSADAIFVPGRWYSKHRYWNNYTRQYAYYYDDHHSDWIRPNRASACSEAADQSGKLITCVTERSASGTRYTDAAPSSGNYVGPYNQSASGVSNKLNYSADGKCYVAGRELPKVIPLTSSKATLEDFFQNATPGGATPGHLGHAWAWYTLSPKWAGVWPAESKPAEYEDQGARKIAIIMTDGEYNTQYSNATSKAQALELCAGMKAQNIEVYTIGFGFSTSSTAGDGTSEGNIKQMLTQCSSGANHYYFPYDAEALRSVFNNIGDGIKGSAPMNTSMKLRE